jgi:hypothetical protein
MPEKNQHNNIWEIILEGDTCSPALDIGGRNDPSCQLIQLHSSSCGTGVTRDIHPTAIQMVGGRKWLESITHTLGTSTATKQGG